MKKLVVFVVTLTVVLTLPLMISSVYAGKNNNGNGFPEGDHYNLNLIAKKSDPTMPGYFTCPSPDDYQWDYYKDGVGICTPELVGTDSCTKCNPDVETCPVKVPSSQNVIFVPRNNDGTPDMKITIRIKSGSDRPGKGNKIKDQYPSLTVSDWCTEHFDGDEAEVMLPENANGYAVYTRVTGRPVEGTAWTFLFPNIEKVQDEYGNDLYFMGTVGNNGCYDADGNYIGDLGRIDTTKGNGKGKGVKDATYLDCLFKYTGQVCYINDLCYYCGDDNLLCESGIFAGNDAGFVCCTDTYDDLGQIFDSCEEPVKSNCVNPVGVDDNGLQCDPTTDPLCVWSCSEGTYYFEPLCRDYSEPTWIFNVADFVDVLWESIGNGAYVVQLRLYPI
jgi:hypothetical protein